MESPAELSFLLWAFGVRSEEERKGERKSRSEERREGRREWLKITPNDLGFIHTKVESSLPVLLY